MFPSCFFKVCHRARFGRQRVGPCGPRFYPLPYVLYFNFAELCTVRRGWHALRVVGTNDSPEDFTFVWLVRIHHRAIFATEPERHRRIQPQSAPLFGFAMAFLASFNEHRTNFLFEEIERLRFILSERGRSRLRHGQLQRKKDCNCEDSVTGVHGFGSEKSD